MHTGHVAGAFVRKIILGLKGARRNTTGIEDTKHALDGPREPLANDHGVFALSQVAQRLCAFFDGKPSVGPPITAGKIAAAMQTQCAEGKAEFGRCHVAVPAGLE